MTERILAQVQAPSLGFLRRVHDVTQVFRILIWGGLSPPKLPRGNGIGVTLHDKVCSCEVRRALNVEPFLPFATPLLQIS